VLRQIFINPMHMPVMTESYLRKDFHFALYLGHCYGKTLVKFFKWSLYSTLIFCAVVIFTNLALEILGDDMIYGLLQFLCFLVAFVILIFMRNGIVAAKKKLVPSVINAEGEMVDPEAFSINVNAKSIDPFEDFAAIPRMEYLEMTADNTTLTEEQRNLVNLADEEHEALLRPDDKPADDHGHLMEDQLRGEADEDQDEDGHDPFSIPNK